MLKLLLLGMKTHSISTVHICTSPDFSCKVSEAAKIYCHWRVSDYADAHFLHNGQHFLHNDQKKIFIFYFFLIFCERHCVCVFSDQPPSIIHSVSAVRILVYNKDTNFSQISIACTVQYISLMAMLYCLIKF